MKNLILFLTVATFSFFQKATAQSCLPDGIAFSTQEQIDSFPINYPVCTEIEGGVWIEGVNINNLNGLSSLSSFESYLVIYNTSLTTLSGLDNLNSIGENLIIWNNEGLSSISNINNLNSVNGDLEIKSNDELATLNGLNNLTFVGGRLYIINNDDLTTLNGLNNLSSIGDRFHIFNNDSLISLSGLDNLSEIDGELIIFNNPTLTSINSLNALSSIQGWLAIRENNTLSTLNGLNNIDYSTIIGLDIIDCQDLAVCNILSICNYFENGGSGNISNNAPGCNSIFEIETACTVPVEELLSVGFNVIEVFPNPTNDILNINSEVTIDHIQITNLLGQKVMILDNTQDLENLNVSHLTPGIYTITFISENQIWSTEFIKQ